MVVNIAVLQ